jgi:hypothetical protein
VFHFKRATKLRRRWSPQLITALFFGGLLTPFSYADTTYITPDNFLHEVFLAKESAEIPKAEFIWLDNSAQTKLTEALGHPYPQARLRYWREQQKDSQKTVWILDEIGKEYPITAGFVVVDKKIQRAQVLVYRESRGMEIHLPAFLAQFINARLTDEKSGDPHGSQLSNKIDGITGATLSVDAMKRMARAALVLDALAAIKQATP